MICNGFKGGIGTASRHFEVKGDGAYTVGVLVQCNYGTKNNLRIAGIPVGREIDSEDPYASTSFAGRGSRIDHRGGGDGRAAGFASTEAAGAARFAWPGA